MYQYLLVVLWPKGQWVAKDDFGHDMVFQSELACWLAHYYAIVVEDMLEAPLACISVLGI